MTRLGSHAARRDGADEVVVLALTSEERSAERVGRRAVLSQEQLEARVANRLVLRILHAELFLAERERERERESERETAGSE